jgi:hypothetical protein
VGFQVSTIKCVAILSVIFCALNQSDSLTVQVSSVHPNVMFGLLSACDFVNIKPVECAFAVDSTGYVGIHVLQA